MWQLHSASQRINCRGCQRDHMLLYLQDRHSTRMAEEINNGNQIDRPRKGSHYTIVR